MGVNNLLKFRKSINVIYAISYMPPKKKNLIYWISED